MRRSNKIFIQMVPKKLVLLVLLSRWSIASAGAPGSRATRRTSSQGCAASLTPLVPGLQAASSPFVALHRPCRRLRATPGCRHPRLPHSAREGSAYSGSMTSAWATTNICEHNRRKSNFTADLQQLHDADMIACRLRNWGRRKE